MRKALLFSTDIKLETYFVQSTLLKKSSIKKRFAIRFYVCFTFSHGFYVVCLTALGFLWVFFVFFFIIIIFGVVCWLFCWGFCLFDCFLHLPSLCCLMSKVFARP